MKRHFFLTVVLVFVVCAMGSALAEDFTLRNGILFTDTKDTIMKKETFEFVNEYSDSIRFKGTLLNMIANVDYYFNEKSELSDMCYSFGNYKADFFGLLFTNTDDMDNGYKKLKENMVLKYGQSTETNDALDACIGKAVKEFYAQDDTYGFMPEYKCVASDYDVWVVPLADGGIVKIDLISYKMKLDNKGYLFNHINLSYKYVSSEEYISIKEKQTNTQQAVIDAL